MKKHLYLFLSMIPFIGINQALNIDWQKSFGSTYNELGSDIVSDGANGYILATAGANGTGDISVNKGGQDFWIVRMDIVGNILWEKSFGGAGTDIPTGLVIGNDGVIYIAGYTNSTDQDVIGNNGQEDIWLIKLDTSGNLIWAKAFGGGLRDRATDMILNEKGELIIGGISQSYDGDFTANYGSYDYFLMAIDTSGIVLWEKNYGGSATDQLSSIANTLDKGYVLTGITNSSDQDVLINYGNYDYFTIKVDSLGVIEWTSTIGGSGIDDAKAVIQLNDSSYLVGGKSLSKDFEVDSVYDDNDVWLIHYDKTGSVDWKKTMGGNDYDEFLSFYLHSNGNVYASGGSESTDGELTGINVISGSDAWVFQLDPANGNIITQMRYGGTAVDFASNILENNNGDLIFSGITYSINGDVTYNNGGSDCWVVKLNPTPTSLPENSSTVNSLVYPNPSLSGEVINIKAPFEINYIELLNIQGEIVQSLRASLQQNISMAPSIKEGIYFLNLYGSTMSVSHRIVIKK